MDNLSLNSNLNLQSNNLYSNLNFHSNQNSINISNNQNSNFFRRLGIDVLESKL